MSQSLADEFDTNNDVENNNQPEWNKVCPSNGANLSLNETLRSNVYSGENTKHYAGKNDLNHTSKQGDTNRDSRFSNIQDGLETSISTEGKERVQRILNDVNHLSDVEKLLLYLKLPTGASPDDGLRQTPTSFLHSSNRIEQAQAFTWIRSHLEEDSEICVPKHEVYDDYRLYCESHNLKPLCPADFGKVMKCVFPNVKPRRLGQRGQSKYCYSGLRKKLEVQPPALPELEITPKKEKEEKSEEDEVYAASRQLVCEWAHKLLGGNFTNLRELAEFLVGNLYVNSKSTAAFTVLAAMQDAGLHNSKVPVSSLFTCSSGGNKHKETQLQLQRKLQERELIKEQKRKLQQQRCENERENEQLRSQTLSVSPAPFQSPAKSAARNITKLLQSPGAGDSSLKLSPHLFQQVTNHITDRMTTDGENGDNSHSDQNFMEVQISADYVASKASAMVKQTDSAQFHVVKKPAVRQANQSFDEAGNTDVQTETDNQDHATRPDISPNEKSSDKITFALPTTPSRSAFVPVSNQWKEQCSGQNLSDLNTVMPSDDDEQKRTIFMEGEDTDHKSISVSSFSLDSLLGDSRLENKLVNSPVTTNSDVTINLPSSPQTPKKSRSRFTPIRPKVTPTKTVSSILKDQKNVNGDGPAYDSRPVSAILKEKRAREAQEILVQLASNVQFQGQIPQNINVSGPVSSLGTDILKLPMSTGTCQQSNEVFIIVGSPKPGSAKANGKSTTDAPSGVDMQDNSHFPPNVTATASRCSIPLALLLSRQDEEKVKTGRCFESSSVDNSDVSDNGNFTDSEVLKSDDIMSSRDTDTPSGRKRKSSDRDTESKTKRMNSTDVRNGEDDVFLPQVDTHSSVSVASIAKVNSSSVEKNSSSDKKENRTSGGKLSVESLESDALLDTAPMAVDQNLVSSLTKPSLPSMQTASVGVSAKAMRPTQKQLLQQKLQLDQRVSNFFSKGQKSPKELEDMSKQMKIINKAKMEEILQQYIQQHQKSNTKSDTKVCSSRKVPAANNQPVNLLSLLQQPIFDCTKVVLSTVSKTKPDETNTESLSPRLPNKLKNQHVLNNITQTLGATDQLRDLESSDLPSDVADFITENMMSNTDNSSLAVNCSLNQQLKEIKMLNMPTKGQNNLQRDKVVKELSHNNGLDTTQSTTVDNSSEKFTVPSTPPPLRLKLDVTNVKHRFAPVQRSSSLPVFAPPLLASQCHTTFLSLGKGLDMPAPPNRVIDSSSPRPLPKKSSTPVNFTSPGRLPLRSRQTSTDRVSNHTPMSDAGYHSFDASPVMNSTPVPITGNENIVHTATNTSALLLRPDSAQSFASEPLAAQSPAVQSPQAASAHSTPSSVVSPQIASHSSVNVSPFENITSPNSFMPIQGSVSSSCSPVGSPQLVTPIKPQVTVATSPNNSVSSMKFSSNILMKLTSREDLPTILHMPSTNHSEEHKNSNLPTAIERKETSVKTGVLQKLLNSTSLPSYEEAMNNLGRGKMDDIEMVSISVSKSENSHPVCEVTTNKPLNISSQSVSSMELERNQNVKVTLEKGTDCKVISTSEYPFSYQLALLREKCLNPTGKENEKKNDINAVGKSVQRNTVDLKPSDPKSISSANSVLMTNSEETNFKKQSLLQLETAVPGQAINRSNVVHHRYGSAVQKSSGVASMNSSASVSAQYVQSKSTTVIRPSTDSAHTRTVSSSMVPSAVSSSNKQRQTATVFPTFDLPNVNYMGNAPNIDLGSILQSKQNTGAGQNNSSDNGCGDHSRLTLMQALQPTQTINEEELQSTLEILRSLDSQYFSQSDLDLDTMQPCVQPPCQHSSQLSPSLVTEPRAANPTDTRDSQENQACKRSWSYENDVSSR